MQRIATLWALVTFCLTAPFQLNAQGELEVFSELGETFTLYVNQMKQNASPAARVEVKDMQAGYYQVRIDFENPSLPDFAQNNVGVEGGVHATYLVKLSRKGEYVLRMNGYAPIGSAQTSVQSMPPPAGTGYDISMDVGTVTPPAAAGTSSNSSTESISMNVNLGNMMQAAAGALGNMNVSVTTTTTTTTSGSGMWGGDWAAEPQATTSAPVASSPQAMSSMDFDDYLAAIRSKTFEDSKLSTAKAPLSGQYLTARQIKQVMQVFTFEDTRLEFAIFAHSRCVDPSNYYQVYEAFEFELSIDDLQEAIGE